MSRNVVNGYQKFPEDMLVLEPEDWTNAEWNTLCKLSGLPAKRTERIVLNVSSTECYINPDENSDDQKFCEKQVFLFADGSLHLTGYSDTEREIVIPPVVGHDIFEALKVFYAEEDIKQRLTDSEDANAEFITRSDISKMAQKVVSLEDNNDGISERHWNIVDEVIKNFLSNF